MIEISRFNAIASTTNATMIAKPPHIGQVTIHHGQSMTFVSLRTRNTMNNDPGNEMVMCFV